MRKEFLNLLIRKFPNYMELAAAVTEYNRLIQINRADPKKIEEIVLSKTFRSV